MAELREGMRVRIKSADPCYDEIRDKLLTLIESFTDGDSASWYVDFDGRKDDWLVGEDDMYPVNVTVIEGVAQKYTHGKTTFDDDWLDNHFDCGKRYRVTIEEVQG